MKKLRTGYTTGACSAASAKAAALLLAGADEPVQQVEIPLANGARATLAVKSVHSIPNGARAVVIKDAGDDPDITNGASVVVELFHKRDGGISFEAGEGVGTVTRPGLSAPVGAPAINPGPIAMISGAVREVTDAPLKVRISIPGGAELAGKTFNPRLGVVGGLSVLGTTGIVRPYSHSAIKRSIALQLDVALAEGVTRPVFTPGNIGARSATRLFGVSGGALVEVGNEWGYIIDIAVRRGIAGLLVVGHPGKLAKLPAGQWDTHSKRSSSAVPYVMSIAIKELGASPPGSDTVEGVFMALPSPARNRLGERLAVKISNAIEEKAGHVFKAAVALVNMKGELLGVAGDTSQWNAK